MPSYRARLVLLADGSWLAPGEIEWDARGRIVALRRARRQVRDAMVLPGLVDAHVHLQLPALPRRQTRFPAWIRAVMAARAADGPDAARQRAQLALRELLASGTTAVGEIDSSGLSPEALAEVPMSGRCYQELTGFHLDRRGAGTLIRARVRAGSRSCLPGLSPHAPYSASPALLQAAAACARSLAIHVAEVPEEQQFLREGTGPFAELLAELGRLPARFSAPGVGAVAHLQRLGVLRPGTLLVHCQHLERGDAARIAAAGATIAVCPGTIGYFRRSPPPVPDWLAAGIPVALGTDSRASNGTLSMRDELQRAARLWPDLAPRTLLAMATAHGGAALGRPGLGRLRRGGRADFLAVRIEGERPERELEAFVHGRRRLAGTWLAGRPCRPSC